MFNPITIPYGCKMLFNIAHLKDGVTIEDVELVVGEMCNTVKNTYGNESGGFIAGQVFKYAGFISKEGSVGEHKDVESHVIIVTYWDSFEQHEKSHADHIFLEKFKELEDLCEDTYELGYDMLWQGEPE